MFFFDLYICFQSGFTYSNYNKKTTFVFMNINERISALSALGKELNVLKDDAVGGEFWQLLITAENFNPWFTQANIQNALHNIISMLTKEALEDWLNNYKSYSFSDSNIKVGVIMAGNIPLVGFHDFLSVIISGKVFVGKLSSSDKILLPYIANLLIKIEPRFADKIIFEDELMKNFDAVIATGSNNSSRYFDYYFGKYPNIIRKNRNSLAILTGEESPEQLVALGNDIFSYFGLGCRNVSKLLLPKGYEMSKLLDNFESFSQVSMHSKYLNNYEYQKSLLLINNTMHFDNGFLLLREKPEMATAVSVLNYEYYDDYNAEIRRLNMVNEQIQCIVEGKNMVNMSVYFGETQSPSLMEYADNVDVIEFLNALK